MDSPLAPDEIRQALQDRFGSLAAFERAKNLPYRSVSLLLIGKAIMPTAEAIADELNVPVHRVSAHYHRQYYNLSTVPSHRREADAAHRLSGAAK